MRIDGFVVCVGEWYTKNLEFSLRFWKPTLDGLTVVTSVSDTKTAGMCSEEGIECYITDSFYEDGAYFNKGRALSRCLEWKLPYLHEKDWILFFDADIVPPPDWRKKINESKIDCQKLYGANRMQYDPSKAGGAGNQILDNDPCGFFCMAHSSTPPMQKHPVFNVNYTHAGNYDSEFLDQWKKEDRVMLSGIRLLHHGEPQENWFGLGNIEKVRRMNQLRAAGNHWKTEKVGKRF